MCCYDCGGKEVKMKCFKLMNLKQKFEFESHGSTSTSIVVLYYY